jgi:hypothetical protein
VSFVVTLVALHFAAHPRPAAARIDTLQLKLQGVLFLAFLRALSVLCGKVFPPVENSRRADFKSLNIKALI